MYPDVDIFNPNDHIQLQENSNRLWVVLCYAMALMIGLWIQARVIIVLVLFDGSYQESCAFSVWPSQKPSG
jgi:hypothetical protein